MAKAPDNLFSQPWDVVKQWFLQNMNPGWSDEEQQANFLAVRNRWEQQQQLDQQRNAEEASQPSEASQYIAASLPLAVPAAYYSGREIYDSLTPEFASGGSSAGVFTPYPEITGGGAGAGVPGTPTVVGSSLNPPIGTAVTETGAEGILLADGTVVPVEALTGAEALGQSITTGLEGLGVGAETASALGGSLGYALPAVGAGLGVYGLYDQLRDTGSRRGLGGQAVRGASSGAAIGAGIGSFVPGGTLVGGALGAGIGGLAGALHGLTSSGKGEQQLRRDAARDAIRGTTNIYEGDLGLIPTGGGSYYDTRLAPNKSYNLDWSNPGVSMAVGATGPLAAALLGGADETTRRQIQSELSNAVLSSQSPTSAITELYKNSGLNRHQISGGIWEAFGRGEINEGERDAYLAETDLLFGVNNPQSSEEDRKRAQTSGRYGMLG